MRIKLNILLLLMLALLLAQCTDAQIIEKYKNSGPDDKRLNLVFTGDGYTSAQQDQFRYDAVNLSNSLLSTSPWDSYSNSVNVYLVGAISNESGADKPPEGVYRDTIFDSTYYCAGIERLLVSDYGKVTSYVAARVPTFDYIIVLVNDTKYGGSGGYLAVASLHSESQYLVRHELAHSYADLHDEYVSYGEPYTGDEPYEPNVTINTNRSTIKWKAFISASTPIPTVPQENYQSQIGLFEGAAYYSSGIYRPAYDCEMRSRNVGFCKVCKEAHCIKIHDYAPLLDSLTPSEGTKQITSDTAFTAAGLGFFSLTRAWTLDGKSRGAGPSITINPLQCISPTSTLTVTVTDNSSFIANYPKPTETHTWTLVPYITPVTSVAQAKQQSAGLYVIFAGVVSAVFSDSFYVQDENRASGIKITGYGVKPALGKKVALTGGLSVTNPLLTLTNSKWTTDSADPVPPEPIGLNNRSLGGAACGLQQGVKDGIGTNNICLLVKSSGVVTYVNTIRQYFYMDDGSSLHDGSGYTGIKVYGTVPVAQGENPVGKYVSAVGVSYCEALGSDIIRAIKTRGTGDVVLIK